MKRFTATFKKDLIGILNLIEQKNYRINAGGCGRFARVLGKILTTKGFKVEYVFINRWRDSNKDCNRHIKDNNINIIWPTQWTHIMLLVNNIYLIDITGIKLKNEFYSSLGSLVSNPLSLKQFNTFMNCGQSKGRWNSIFRPKYMPSISRNLNTALA